MKTLILCLLPLVAFAQEKELRAMEDQWVQAELKNDTAFFSALLADGWVTTSPEGVLRNKSQFLARLRSGAVKITASRIDDVKVMVYGDAAVVTGRWSGKGTEDGKPFSENLRWTDVYSKIDGRWRCVASHSSAVK